tara:strand:+ start:898 stop:1092 length:195 start_codon:yes stop_codon:yes gene_type:complete
MALRNPETLKRLTERIEGNLKNLKLMVKSQQPVEDFIKKIDQTQDYVDQLRSTLEREDAVLRQG